MNRDLVVGVVRAKHDIHKAAGEVRHTVGYHASNGHVVYCDASGIQNFIEGNRIMISCYCILNHTCCLEPWKTSKTFYFYYYYYYKQSPG